MSILGKLFDRKPETTQESATDLLQPNPANDPAPIRVFDKYGQEFLIAREEWRTNLLPGALRSAWNKPDELYGTIVNAMSDGFFVEVLGAAEQLHRIDHVPSRAACVYGIALLKNNLLDNAESVLRASLEKDGEDGSVLTNLAKVYAGRNEMPVAEDILWHALEVDPNQQNGFSWYLALQRERLGEKAALHALGRMAAIPGSWRAQLWLAKRALESNDLPQALAYYRECLSRLGQDVPVDFLLQVTGDLGNYGYLAESLELCEPGFVAEIHGLQVGNNLIKTHLDLGHLDDARRILDQLYSLKRPDWREALGYWDSRIAQSRVATTKVPANASLNMTLLLIEGPVWLKPSSPAARLFPAISEELPTISFLGSTASLATDSQDIQVQMSDAPGRLSRALPLFLAEQVKFACQAKVQTIFPWIEDGSGGFAMIGVPFSDDDAVDYATRSESRSDFLVASHLQAQSDPWLVELRLFRTDDGTCLGRLETSFSCADPGERLRELSLRLVSLLREQDAAKQRVPASVYQVPDSAHLDSYLLRLEQLLAVRCAAMEGVAQGFLSGEREILDGNLQLCLACPQNVATRLLLAETLLAMNRVRPEVVQEFSERIAQLQKEKPLSEPAQAIVQEMLTELIAL